MSDPVESLKQTSGALLVAETDLDPTRVDLPPHEAFGLISAARRNIDRVISHSSSLEDMPPAPVGAGADNAKEPQDNTQPIPPQKPSLPAGGDHDESEGGLPEKQPSQNDDS
ncbi:MAG: hypothetical protein Q7T86_16790 [Hyphomicrobiaceae bacterium]|jgi:hypothetical protein|nr:hypothetical protein [Hyphomicrobiaceae bacterium]